MTKELTIATPFLSARVIYTKKVDRITDINGAIAGTQKNFLFLFPCSPKYVRVRK
jgi:hypothetical protein